MRTFQFYAVTFFGVFLFTSFNTCLISFQLSPTYTLTLTLLCSLFSFRLESSTRSLEMVASKGIHLQSTGGTVKVVSQVDLSLKSTEGALIVHSRSIRMPHLPLPKGSFTAHQHKIFQMCVCGDGKLFLASPESACSSRNLGAVCG